MMAVTGLGDQARLFAGLRHNTAIRERMATLTQEMSTGVAADMAAHLGGDLAGLADVDRRLRLAEGYAGTAQEAANRLAAMQVTLARAEGARGGLANRLITATGPAGTASDQALAAEGARAAFHDVAVALNARLGNAALFAGTATEGAALAPASAMMAAIGEAVADAGATTAAGVRAALDAWFDDPAGGFAAMGYLGSGEDLARGIDEGAGVTLAARADDPALKGLLKAAAAAALAGDPALPDAERAALLAGARDDLLSLSRPLAALQSTLGTAEARVEEAQARHAARATAFGIMRTEMTQVDPFATASEIEAVRTQLETHYALTDRLSRLNLVSFLR